MLELKLRKKRQIRRGSGRGSDVTERLTFSSLITIKLFHSFIKKFNVKKLFIFCAAVFISATAFCQMDSADQQAPYLKYPTIPEFTLYKAPDSTAFNREDLKKKKNTIFIVFSPECSHCQHETEMLTENIKQFKNTQFVMLTYLPFNEMMDFYHHYHIANYPQITMARDTKFFFPIYFRVRNLPSIFVYDKSGHLKKSFEGDVKPESLIAAL